MIKRIAPEVRDHRHHARNPARRRSCRGRSCSRTRCRTCRPACISPSSIPGVGGCAPPARAARRRRAAVRRARQRVARARGRPRRRRRSRRTSSRTPRTRSSRSRARSTAGISSRPPPRISRSACALAELGPPIDPDGARAARLPVPRSAATRIAGDGARRRPLRERRAQPRRASTSTRPAIVPGTRVELAARGNRVLRRRCAHVQPTRRAGELILYEDSYRNIAVAVTRGSAASLLGVRGGQRARDRGRRDLSASLVVCRQGSLATRSRIGPDTGAPENVVARQHSATTPPLCSSRPSSDGPGAAARGSRA